MDPRWWGLGVGLCYVSICERQHMTLSHAVLKGCGKLRTLRVVFPVEIPDSEQYQRLESNERSQ